MRNFNITRKLVVTALLGASLVLPTMASSLILVEPGLGYTRPMYTSYPLILNRTALTSRTVWIPRHVNLRGKMIHGHYATITRRVMIAPVYNPLFLNPYRTNFWY